VHKSTGASLWSFFSVLFRSSAGSAISARDGTRFFRRTAGVHSWDWMDKYGCDICWRRCCESLPLDLDGGSTRRLERDSGLLHHAPHHGTSLEDASFGRDFRRAGWRRNWWNRWYLPRHTSHGLAARYLARVYWRTNTLSGRLESRGESVIQSRRDSSHLITRHLNWAGTESEKLDGLCRNREMGLR